VGEREASYSACKRESVEVTDALLGELYTTTVANKITWLGSQSRLSMAFRGAAADESP
jgi:hypothetical protein